MPNTTDTAGHYRYTKEKEAVIIRMRRIAGQARGIEKMIEEERYCIDIVQQINALSSAADEVTMIILQSHIEGCVTEAIREKRGNDYIKELMATIRKAKKR